MKNILITGGAGFIGSHVVRLFVNNYPDYQVYNLDSLTYAGNLENLSDIENSANYTFIKGDITNEDFINNLFEEHQFDAVIHLAAESHVDRSITDPLSFAKTNIFGTMVLLNAFKNLWQNKWEDKLFYHVSTDEVYGTLGETGLFTETTSYDPNSPYSASKGSSDHFSNEGVCYWYDFAKAIFELSEISVKVKPIETSQYPTPASDLFIVC